jgi:hypothetical protein
LAAPKWFLGHQDNGGQMAAIFAKGSAHGEDTVSRLAVSNDVPRESNSP